MSNMKSGFAANYDVKIHWRFYLDQLLASRDYQILHRFYL